MRRRLTPLKTGKNGRKIVFPFFILRLTAIISGFILCGAACSKKTVPAGGVSNASDWPIFRGDAALTGTAAGRLPDRLALDFTFTVGRSVSASPVIGDGKLFVASVDGSLTAWSLGERKKLWEFRLADGFEAPPLYVSGRNLVVAGGMDGVVYALDAAAGKTVWRAETGAQIMGSANIFENDGAAASILVGSYDNSFYAFALDSGKREWSFETGNYLNGTAAVAEGLAAIGGCDAYLHLYDLAAGREAGAADTGAYIAGSAALADGVAYVGNYAGRFLAVDVRSRKTLWTFSLSDGSRGFTASPAVTDARVIIGATDGFLYCLDRRSGGLEWRHRGGDEYSASAVAAGGRVLAVSADGEAAVLDIGTGRPVAVYRIGAGVKGSPALGAGRIAVAALDGRVYIFKGE